MRTRSRPAALLLAAALISIPLGGCVTLAPRSRPPGERAKIVPGIPLVRFGPERCGAGALASVLNALGDPVTIEQLDAVLPKAPGGGVLSRGSIGPGPPPDTPCSSDPRDADALNNLAWLLLEEGRWLGDSEDLARKAAAAGGEPRTRMRPHPAPLTRH